MNSTILTNPLAGAPIKTVAGELDTAMREMTLDQMCEFHSALLRDLDIIQERVAVCRAYMECCQKRLIQELQPRPQAARG